MIYTFLRFLPGYLDADFVEPPDNIPNPNKKPSVYHLPVLFTANTAISLLNKDDIKEKGEINPCHKPPQNPYM
jgi:hypothetical protein